ncbi:F-box only protein 24-like [Amia ocellicauda]|uniref:F-box only protein 24-like n=1 Tax=Amia ocellicauda TaxID=2972642 RepID=UPI0034646CA5
MSDCVSPLSQSLGHRKFLPTTDSLFLLDYSGQLFLLRTVLMLEPNRGHMTWRPAYCHTLVCDSAKDMAADPCSDVSGRQLVYVLVTRPPEVEGWGRGDCVEVYQQHNRHRVYKITFHPSLTFTQLCLMGSEARRSLLLLSDEGMMYSLQVDETQLDESHIYTLDLAMRRISELLPRLPIRQIHSNRSSVLYLTEGGSVYLELHTSEVCRQLFGTDQGFHFRDPHVPLALPLPSKVVSVSLGPTHLSLLDVFGRLFMQGSNHYGQLGTGDKIDRGEPTQVALSAQPVSVWCGLNHSLALLRGAGCPGAFHGCGCGGGGRLPGWPKGSNTFVCLQVQVPPCVRSFCSSYDFLFFLCCHDIAEEE